MPVETSSTTSSTTIDSGRRPLLPLALLGSGPSTMMELAQKPRGGWPFMDQPGSTRSSRECACTSGWGTTAAAGGCRTHANESAQPVWSVCVCGGGGGEGRTRPTAAPLSPPAHLQAWPQVVLDKDAVVAHVAHVEKLHFGITCVRAHSTAQHSTAQRGGKA
jgi:hypothetical protein